MLALAARPGAVHAAEATPLTAAAQFRSIAPRIVNGVVTSQYPSTGALLYGNLGTAGMICSGTLIGCETFLTAGHCVDGDLNPAHYFIFLQHAGIFSVSSVAQDPDFNFPVGDVAVLKLSAAVTGVAPTPINTQAAPPFGSAGTIVGFGRTGGNPTFNFDYGLKRAGDVTTSTCAPSVSDATSVCWLFEDPQGPPGSNSDTCNGDSGGPLFMDFGCGPTVAGATSGGDSGTCLPTDFSYDANVFNYRSYIQAHGGADLQNAFCGEMPQAGDANAPIVAASGTLNGGSPQGLHSFTVDPGTTLLRVAMNAIDDGSNFNLYVKQGAPPSTSDYDCKSDSLRQYEFCHVDAPTPGTWFVLVNRVSGSGLYQVTATVFGSGSPGSGADGQPCDDGNVCTSPDACQAGTCTGTPVVDGTPCDDGSRCTSSDACTGGVCDGVDGPLNGCKTPFVSGKGLALLKDSASGLERLVWRWSRGRNTSLQDFGNPTAAENYELCVFDRSNGIPDRVLDVQIPAGPNWFATANGFRYRDATAARGGVTSIVLRPGGDGQAAVRLRGKGSSLQIPGLPLDQDPKVTIQLINSNKCWEANYTVSIRNDSVQFKAKAD